MAMDWYGSQAADLAHQVGDSVERGAQAGEPGRAVKEDADRIIARDEKNAWQEKETLDRVLLALLLLSVATPLFAAAHRAAGRRARPPWTPSAFAAIIAAVTALLVAYRIINEPGTDATTTIKIGAPIGLLALVAIGLGAASAFQREVEWAEMRRSAAGSGATADSDASAAPDADAPRDVDATDDAAAPDDATPTRDADASEDARAPRDADVP